MHKKSNNYSGHTIPSANIITHALTDEDFTRIKSLGTAQFQRQGELIFSDGDNADHIYFIESGNVSIFIEKFTYQEEISALGPGEYFGEMAFFSGDRRSASATALTDTTMLGVNKAAFLNFYEANQDIADRIDNIFSKRSNELSFKEHLAGSNIGIKGIPHYASPLFPVSDTTASWTGSSSICNHACTTC